MDNSEHEPQLDEDAREESAALLNEPSDTEHQPDAPNKRLLVLALPALLLCSFVARFDSSFVSGNYARRIAADLHDFKNARWLVLGYLVTDSCMFPLYGHAAQVYGHRPSILFAATALCVALFLCSLSFHLWQLALSRVVIGFGDAGIAFLTTVIINDLVQLHELPLWISATAVAETAGYMLGVPVGATLTDSIGFRMTFGIETFAMILVTLIMYFSLRLPRTKGHATKHAAKKLEIPSAVTLLFAIAAPLFAINLGGEILPWGHPIMIALYCATPIFAYLFYYVETRIAITPIVPKRFLHNRRILVALICILPMKFVFDQLRYSFGTYLEARSFNDNSSFSDWALTCVYLGRPLGTFICGLLIVEYRKFKPFLQLMIAIDLVIFVAFALGWIHPEKPSFAPFLIFEGAAEGVAESLWLVAVLSLVDTEDQPLIYAFFMLTVATSGDLGIAISLATESSLFRSRLQARLKGYKDADEIIRKALEDLKSIRTLPEATQEIVLKALTSSIEVAFGISCVVLLISVASCWFVKEMPRTSERGAPSFAA